jgi:hypothetical protein
MPSRRDFDVARNSACNCLQHTSSLLAIAGEVVPDAVKAAVIASRFIPLVPALSGARPAVSRAEDELTTAALATGPVKAGGMVRPSAHRLAVDVVTELAWEITKIIPELAWEVLPPYSESRPPGPPVVPSEVVGRHLYAIVNVLAGWPAIDAPQVDALIEQERARAIDLRQSERTAASADRPEGHWTGPPAGSGRTPRKRRQPAGPPAELPELINLDQTAALVNRRPDGLRHYRNKGMPKPFIPGTKGQPNQYLWSEMRLWLESQFNRKIPEVAILKFRSSGR